jgi:hypothetical protein
LKAKFAASQIEKLLNNSSISHLVKLEHAVFASMREVLLDVEIDAPGVPVQDASMSGT